MVDSVNLSSIVAMLPRLDHRLVFTMPWPAPGPAQLLTEDARQALGVLRRVMRQLHGAGRGPARS